MVASHGALVISGVFDGPLSGGTPKVVELAATADIADLSTYQVEYYFNANTTASVTVSLFGSATAGDFFYLTPNSAEFTTYFGAASDFGGASVNGDDSIVLKDAATTVDTFGSPGTDGTGQPWEYLDGWAYRSDNTTGDGATINLGNWTFSGINENDGESSNATATNPFPIGSYVAPAVPEPSTALLGSLALLGLVRRKR